MLDILYQDNHLLVVHKPAGLLTQGDKTGDATALEAGKAHIRATSHKPGNVFLGLVHRIDRPVALSFGDELTIGRVRMRLDR